MTEPVHGNPTPEEIDANDANTPTTTQPAPNISTEHQNAGDARRPSDKLDRGHDSADDGGRKSSLTRNE